ncbi:hypothetical protein GGQ64_004330 [Rhizobium azooxidifex]|uniref:Uncharacterized protein n=1 Tax=Mycoplana azooxidifex TaxID=1636188 RepID=A0A7W6DHG1_9HYPH|nr:hypothetical protein [Mycoplana azooxidifex]MBB3979094.1 hypothetical protein [Mycoplana azooxidifex]
MSDFDRFLRKPFLSPYDLFGYGLAYQLYQEHGLLTAAAVWTIYAIIVPAVGVAASRGGPRRDD